MYNDDHVDADDVGNSNKKKDGDVDELAYVLYFIFNDHQVDDDANSKGDGDVDELVYVMLCVPTNTVTNTKKTMS